MKRARATSLAEDLLRRLDAGQGSVPLSFVDEVHVFGSYARGAVEPGDLDLDVEFTPDRQWRLDAVDRMRRGAQPYGPLRQALVGNSRSCQVAFNQRDGADYPLTLLWRRGDRLADALARLHAIPVDSSAGRAARDAMLAQFDGIDRWVPRDIREQLIAAIDAGAIAVERVALPDAELSDPQLYRYLRRRWQPTSPLFRAGEAVLAHFEQRGIDPGTVHLHGRDVRDETTPYFAGFQWRYLRGIPSCLTEWGGREWLEVVHPTITGALDALQIMPRDLDRLQDTRWS